MGQVFTGAHSPRLAAGGACVDKPTPPVERSEWESSILGHIDHLLDRATALENLARKISFRVVGQISEPCGSGNVEQIPQSFRDVAISRLCLLESAIAEATRELDRLDQ